MKKLFKLFVVALSLVCVLAFGGWTTEPAQERYADAPLLSPISSEIVEFSSRTVESYYTPGVFPYFTQETGMTNCCGAVAGAEIVAFYDKYFDDLIPGWDACYANGRYRLKDDVYIPALMWEMYDLMQTNVHDVGVSEQEFLNGLSAYINGKGHSVSYNNVVNGSNFDFETYKSELHKNKVTALLAHAGDIYIIGEDDTQDKIVPINIAGSHIMVAFGYDIYRYYDANGNLFRTDYYLEVAVGLSSITVALYKVNPHNLSAAYIVDIK